MLQDSLFLIFHMVNFHLVSEDPQIIRSRRKTFSIEIHPGGRIVVRVPQQASREQIDILLKAKASWIIKKLAQQRALPSRFLQKKFVEGELFDYLGKSYPVRVVEQAANPLELNGKYFLLRQKNLPNAREIFESWYRMKAREVLTARVNYFAGEYGFNYRRLQINGARTRWGSCSSRGGLNFTWRLVQAPPPVIDYVVVHELAHLKVPNHSKAFWDLVRNMLPDYAEKRAWLKTHSHRLSV